MEKVSVVIDGLRREVQHNEQFPAVSSYLKQRQEDIAKLLGSPEVGQQAWLGRRRASMLFLQTNRDLLEAQMATVIPDAAEDLEHGDKEPSVQLIQQDLHKYAADLNHGISTEEERAFVMERARLGLTALASLVGEEQVQQQRERFQRFGI